MKRVSVIPLKCLMVLKNKYVNVKLFVTQSDTK